MTAAIGIARIVRPTLYAALAFNLIFLIQELFLVLPKAFLPGVTPILFHNNHDWSSHHPMVELFQGTGVLTILIVGLGCALALRGDQRTADSRLALWWIALMGLALGLLQVALLPINEKSDVARALNYLSLTGVARTALAVAAVVAIPIACAVLVRRLPDRATARTMAVSGLLAVPLILPFRIPREPIEVIAPPLLVALIAGLCIVVEAQFWKPSGPALPALRAPLWAPALALAGLLAIFQLLLRPGISF